MQQQQITQQAVVGESSYQEAPEFKELLAKENTIPDITFDDGNFARCERLAKLMASGAATIPKHLQGNVADCFAIVLQTFAWGMNNPFAVAQKTHVINGFLGYEAQLVNAVAQASGQIVGHFKYEYRGEGMQLECRVGAVIKGDTEITWGEWLNRSLVTVTNSPLWKTNPRQQFGYLQVKNWLRAFYPGLLMGVYTTDELFDGAGTQYDQIKPEDLATPQAEVDAVITEINAAPSMEALELLKSKAGLIKGEGYKTALAAYKTKRKALSEQKQVEQQPAQTTEIDNSVIVDDVPDPKNAEPDKYADLRIAISECETISDIARLLKELPVQAKADLKTEIQARQDAINATNA